MKAKDASSGKINYVRSVVQKNYKKSFEWDLLDYVTPC